MSSPYQAAIDQLRSVGHSSIMNSYTTLGAAFSNPGRLCAFTNTTDADMLISTDGSNDYLIVPAGTAKIFDLCTNRRSDDFIFAFAAGTQFYVKYVSSPSKGSIYLEVIYGN